MNEYSSKLEQMFLDGGHRPEVEVALRTVEQLMDTVQLDMDRMTGSAPENLLLSWSRWMSLLWSTGLENRLKARLASANASHRTSRENLQEMAEVEDVVQRQHQLYSRKVDQVQNLLEEVNQNLERAKNELRSAVSPEPHCPIRSRGLQQHSPL